MAIVHALAEHQAGAGHGAPDGVEEQARADSATFMRQWQTEAIILGWQGADETHAAAPIPDEAKADPLRSDRHYFSTLLKGSSAAQFLLRSTG